MHDGVSLKSYDVKAMFDELTCVNAKKKLAGELLDGGYQAAGAFWRYVKTAGGLAIGDWKFVAEPREVEAILKNGDQYDVREYDKRMRATSGRFYLGMDGEEHSTDASLGDIIPSWNRPDGSTKAESSELARVEVVAEAACRAALALYGQLAVIARDSDPNARMRVALPQIIGPVLDACAAEFFGIAGPSSLSLFSWAASITRYHFRPHADAGSSGPYPDEADRAAAGEASGQYRSHVLAALAEPDRLPPHRAQRLKSVAARLAELLTKSGRKASGSDDDVARNLIGILTGSLTATYKAVSDALAIRADAHGDIWAGISEDRSRCRFPLHDSIVAGALAATSRGSLDAVYRTYNGPRVQLGSIAIEPNDRVIVWLGGTLATPDNLYGIGMHKCPGMDMGKAMIEGALRALTQLTGDNAPRVEREEDLLYLVFPHPDAVVELMQERHSQPARS